MKITFLGAARTVTGSNFLVEAAGKRILVDCGMYQGKATEELENSDPFLYNPAEIDYMILTHAHIDHSGRIPKLFNEGFKGPVYATKATVDLCAIMLPDSGHIQETEIEWQNKKRKRLGKAPLPPLYTAQDAIDCMEIFSPVEYDEIVQLDENISARFNDAGHMLGSAIIELWVNENGKITKTVFTGDLGNNDLPLLDSPTMIDHADYVVMESTYGNRLHMRNDEKANLFLKIVSETLDYNGTVVIPSFAVGRTQEILYEINKIKEERGKYDEEFARQYQTLMNAKVYVDSPLAISATEIFRMNTNLFDEEIQKEIISGDNPLEFPGLHFTQTVEESRALNESKEPCIIISASGMCDVGRIKHHLKHNLWNPTSTILFVGYQAPGTLGRQIVDGAKSVRIFGEEIAVNARVEYIEGYSGHADQEWLLNFVYSFHNQPKHIFLVHGEPDSQDVLKGKIEENTGIPVTIPNFGESFSLDGDMPEMLERPQNLREFDDHLLRLDILDAIESMKNEISSMENNVKEGQFEANGADIESLSEKIRELQNEINNMMKK